MSDKDFPFQDTNIYPANEGIAQGLIFQKDPHLKVSIASSRRCSICEMTADVLLVETMAPEICQLCLFAMFRRADEHFGTLPR